MFRKISGMGLLIIGLLWASIFAATTAQAQDKTMIVLDGSGSMWGQIDGISKIEMARITLIEVLENIPETMDLGLMAYGHRQKGQCDDIELLVPSATGTGSAIAKAAQSVSPKGKTPLSEAV
ncbi:MAG: VWA domain-containing protein, partial [Rhizobiales bacterium]|nr:VWA domain-containing protein [Hyphomicrobiales bacterium]